ncbi:heavy-metal-associated domain-containing protein [Caballeronia glebae]|uniref:heavy-metal-associated domain-containing protein n=1 Tax=Caballeronia glebae TaxID=1777143 RepID=UPI0038B890F4
MKFEVKDMSCGGCANAITQAITQEDAAAKVAIDVASKVVEVQSTASQQRLMAAIETAGFHPTVLSS